MPKVFDNREVMLEVFPYQEHPVRITGPTGKCLYLTLEELTGMAAAAEQYLSAAERGDDGGSNSD